MVALLRREAEVPVRIEVPDKTAVQCSGVVVWSKPNGAAGIRFTKLADEHKAVLTAWLAALEQGASETSPQRDEFARITAQITAMKLNNADALSLIARRVSQLANASGVTIALGKPENMICLARSGEAPELGTPVRPSGGLISECVRARKLVVVHDATTDPRAAELRTGSVLIMPLLVNTELRGVMQVLAAHPLAFDAKTIDIVQKLADAVVFVTHNVMPQPRLATVTSLPKPTTPMAPPAVKPSETGRITPMSAPPIAKPSDTGRMTAYSAPPVTKPSDSGRLTAFSATPIKKPSDSGGMTAYSAPLKPVTPISTVMPAVVSSVPVATPLPIVSERSTQVEVAPLAEAVQPSPSARPPVEVIRPLTMSTVKPLATLDPSPNFHPVERASNKMPLIAVAAVLLVAAPVGIYFWRHHQPHAVTTAAAATTTPAPVTNVPPVVESNITVTAATQPAVTPTSNTEHAPAHSAATPAIEKTPAPAEKPSAEKPSAEKKQVVVEAAVTESPAPAAMVLASGRPVEHKLDDADTAAPSAQLLMHAPSSLPGVALPSTAAPKLAAPVAKTWTGGNLLQRIAPVYPQAAIARGLEGPVQLQAIVTSKGTVDKVRAVSGHPLLVQAATDAVKRWRYEPFKADGEPVDKEISITLNFKIPR
jgi:protein TonB